MKLEVLLLFRIQYYSCGEVQTQSNPHFKKPTKSIMKDSLHGSTVDSISVMTYHMYDL